MTPQVTTHTDLSSPSSRVAVPDDPGKELLKIGTEDWQKRRGENRGGSSSTTSHVGGTSFDPSLVHLDSDHRRSSSVMVDMEGKNESVIYIGESESSTDPKNSEDPFRTLNRTERTLEREDGWTKKEVEEGRRRSVSVTQPVRERCRTDRPQRSGVPRDPLPRRGGARVSMNN